MPDIMDGYNRAKEMGRKGDKLSVSYDFGKRDNQMFAVGHIQGGSEPHDCKIVWPAKGSVLSNQALHPKRPDNDALYHCDCQDFRFTFFPYIQAQGEALDVFPPYVPNGRGVPRAIDGYGMCKHVMALFDALKKDGKIVV